MSRSGCHIVQFAHVQFHAWWSDWGPHNSWGSEIVSCACIRLLKESRNDVSEDIWELPQWMKRNGLQLQNRNWNKNYVLLETDNLEIVHKDAMILAFISLFADMINMESFILFPFFNIYFYENISKYVWIKPMSVLSLRWTIQQPNIHCNSKSITLLCNQTVQIGSDTDLQSISHVLGQVK